VFDVNGNLTGYKEVLPTGENDLIEEADNSERVSIRAKSGESYIYGVANINSSTTYYLNAADLALLNIDEGTNDEEYYRNIERSELTRDKFLSINFNRRYGADENAQISPDPVNKRFVMSGYINDGQTVTIPKGNNGSASLPEGQNIIKLYRILAKNTLTITNGTTSNGGKFTAKSYRLCNVPISGNLVPKAGINTTTSYLENNVTNADVESNFIWNFEGKNEISFYFPENLQIAKNNVTKWKDREKNSWNDGKKTFTNAADKAAYIEIYGDYVDATGEITANVSYTIHLGDFSNATGSMDNFNVIRNYNYRYNVSINGVNDIVVEATTTTDNPYAEGLVINATDGKHYDVDAHFEARVMTFTKASIQALKKNGTGYILNVKTPFGHTYETINVKSDGIYSMTGNKLDEREIFDGEADYFWMKFVKNTEGNTYPCQYPGDNSDKCLNVFELLTELYDESAYTEKGGTEAYYTCFIDEYYYANTLGDCEVTFITNDNKVVRCYTDELSVLDNIVIDKMIHLKNEKNIHLVQTRPYVNDILIKHRKLINKKDGYSAFALMEEPIINLNTLKIKKEEVKEIYIYSDGFSQTFEHLNIYPNHEQMFKKSLDLDEEINKIVDVAFSDPNCDNYPRLKKIDDITVIKVENKTN
jgi:hypothetical protein